MDKDSIKDFVVLSEVMNFSEASEQLYMSQPTLSRKIRALEKELGSKLFKRDTRNIRLTEFGRSFLPFARQILVAYDSAELFISSFKKQDSGSVLVGSVTYPECFGIDTAVAAFQSDHPEVKINLSEHPLLELERLYRDHKLNIYCTVDHTVGKDAHFIPTGTSSLVVLLPEADPLSKNETITPLQLSDKNILLPYEADPFLPNFNDQFREAGITPNVVYKGAAVSSISLVLSGIGISILPVQIAQKYMSDGLCIRELSPQIKFEFGLGYRNRSELNDTELVFLDYITDYLKFFPFHTS